jgi:hypothetical protein
MKLGIIFFESSGKVREALRAKGLDVYSCDILPAEDGSPHHFRGDAREVMDAVCPDFAGFHPPCTYLCGSGIHWNNRGRGWENTETALELVRWCLQFSGPYYLENPQGIISSRIRPPDQYIQPYEYGEDASKKTGLWLNKLPLLASTRRVQGRIVSGKERWANQTDSGQNKLGPSDTRWRERSRTYDGVAQAMAEQWAPYFTQ